MKIGRAMSMGATEVGPTPRPSYAPGAAEAVLDEFCYGLVDGVSLSLC